MSGPRKCMPSNVAILTAVTTPQVTQSGALRLRRAREAAGLSQEQTARLCRVALRTVQRRELGEVDLGALEQLMVLEQIAAEREAA